MGSRVAPAPVERIALSQAHGRVLAEDVHTDRPSPAADVSAMDGYAIRMADVSACTLPIAGDLPIGRAPIPLRSQACLRIYTGAPVPPEADIVIKREDVIEHADRISIPPETLARVRAGDHIRRRGDNGPAGTPFARAGAIITPALAGALSTFGHPEVLVHTPIRVAIFSTGDEVLGAGESPSDYQLRDGNGPSLRALLGLRTWASVTASQRLRDDEAALGGALTQAARPPSEGGADAILLSGGVSMGQRDFVPGAIRSAGGEVVYHKLPQRPGKPMLGAVLADGRPVFGLPGNPMSVLVTAVRIAMPILARRAGARNEAIPTHLRLTTSAAKPQPIWWFRPVRLVAPGEAELVPATGSGDVISIASSDGFIECPPNTDGNGPFAFYPWSGL